MVNEQHKRIIVLVREFEAENISVMLHIAGYWTATLDGQEGLGFPPFYKAGDRGSFELLF